jgi:MoaA/NifB/PqqE/SkfB family radical SAM enzyme
VALHQFRLQLELRLLLCSLLASRRALGIERVQRIAIEAAKLDVSEIFVTGGEPFVLPDIGEVLVACAAAAPTTVFTNGMRRSDALPVNSL